MAKRKAPNAETKPEGGEGVSGLSQPGSDAPEVKGPEPESPKASEEAGPAATAKTDKLPTRGDSKSAIPTPEGHPDTLTDAQKEYIHKERKRELDAAIEEIDKRVKVQQAAGNKSCAIHKKWVETRGVQDVLLARKFTIDKGDDPQNYQIGFPGKKKG